MNSECVNIYRCPYSKSKLVMNVLQTLHSDILEGSLDDESGKSYKIVNGIPLFLAQDYLSDEEKYVHQEYQNMSGYYDNAIEWLFDSFYENEQNLRNKMIDLLEINEDHKVLEVGCGSGRDSVYIANRLGLGGALFLQDISEKMVSIADKKIRDSNSACTVNCFVSSATYLPFPDKYFDSLYSFGGFNEFSDPIATFKEFDRVVKPGGKIVVGDENIAPWLDNTEYAEIIKTNNPIFRRTSLPLKYLPINAKEVAIRWILGSCFYLIDFRVGTNPPQLNLDLPHKGWRGGSLRTRYFGQLEGVNPETKRMAIEVAKKSGLSLSDWLDKAIRNSI